MPDVPDEVVNYQVCESETNTYNSAYQYALLRLEAVDFEGKIIGDIQVYDIVGLLPHIYKKQMGMEDYAYITVKITNFIKSSPPHNFLTFEKYGNIIIVSCKERPKLGKQTVTYTR